MMKRSLVLCVGVGVASLSACGSSSKSNTQPRDVNSTDGGGTDAGEDTRSCGASTLTDGTFDFPYGPDGGTAYTYIVHIPPSYDPANPKRTPLVLNWHGLTSNAASKRSSPAWTGSTMTTGTPARTPAGSFSSIRAVPTPRGMPVLAASSPTSPATTLRSRERSSPSIESQACIDSKRIYSTGMSNGAFMSYRLGCEAADLFAAIAPVAGKVGIPDCHPSRPVPLLAFNGTANPLIPYDTGGFSADNYTAPETVQHWATDPTVDGCTGAPETTYQTTVGDVSDVVPLQRGRGDDVLQCARRGPLLAGDQLLSLRRVHDGHRRELANCGVLQEIQAALSSANSRVRALRVRPARVPERRSRHAGLRIIRSVDAGRSPTSGCRQRRGLPSHPSGGRQPDISSKSSAVTIDVAPRRRACAARAAASAPIR